MDLMIEVPEEEDGPSGMVRGWRRFWLCPGRMPSIRQLRLVSGTDNSICLRRRWHRGGCEGFIRRGGPAMYWSGATSTWRPEITWNVAGGVTKDYVEAQYEWEATKAPEV